MKKMAADDVDSSELREERREREREDMKGKIDLWQKSKLVAMKFSKSTIFAFVLKPDSK